MDAIKSAIDQHDIRFVDLWFTDIIGMVKSVTLPVSQLSQVLNHGAHIDGSSIDGFARVAESDMVVVPDLETFAVLPWHQDAERTARLICNVQTPQGDTFIGDPRTALIRILQDAGQMGFRFKVGVEMEFYVFQTDDDNQPDIRLPYDHASYFDMTTDRAQDLRREMMTMLESLDIQVESTHSEIGEGQHEIDFGYDDALTMADRILTARVALKTVAQRHNLYCAFMPRPRSDMPGSGMHIHQTLHDLKTDDNLFVDVNHEYGLSETARRFLAGQLCHARAMTAILAPLVNSYKRLGTSFEAPSSVSWAHINRAALIRVPSVMQGMESHRRLELRCPDPSSNPYLAMTVMLYAGLDGIRQQMPAPDPVEESLLMKAPGRLRHVETLPATLGEALEALSNDDVMMEALGPYISDRYVEAKRQEFESYNQYVTQWEIDRYLTRY
jgi:glutamine synthetase